MWEFLRPPDYRILRQAYFIRDSLENMKDESADTSEEGKQRKEHQKEAKEREKAANAAKDKILNAVENERKSEKGRRRDFRIDSPGGSWQR